MPCTLTCKHRKLDPDDGPASVKLPSDDVGVRREVGPYRAIRVPFQAYGPFKIKVCFSLFIFYFFAAAAAGPLPLRALMRLHCQHCWMLRRCHFNPIL